MALAAPSPVRITLVEGNHEQLLKQLRAADIDIALTRSGAGQRHRVSVAGAVAAVCDGRRTSPVCQSVCGDHSDLATVPMVLLDMPWSREYFLSLFSEAGVTPNIVMRSGNMEVVRAMVANGVGFGIANVRPKANLSQDGKRVIRVRLAGVNRPMLLGYATVAHAAVDGGQRLRRTLPHVHLRSIHSRHGRTKLLRPAGGARRLTRSVTPRGEHRLSTGSPRITRWMLSAT